MVAAAAAMADEVGLEQLTLTSLAAGLGVRQPSLYKHVDGLDALRRAIALQAADELAEVLSRAAVGRARADAVRAVAMAYRRWAGAHPGRYAALVRAPDPDDGEAVAASARVVGVVVDVLAGFGLHGEEAIHATRALRAGLHGFVDLEARGGFGMPVDVDASFDVLVDGYVRALAERG